MRRDPKALSIEVVIDTALPLRSTMLKWLVDGSSSALSGARSSVRLRGGSPGPLGGRAWLVVISHQPLPADLDAMVRRLLAQAAPGACLEPVRSTPSLLSLDGPAQTSA